jgi:cysteine desulfurase
MSGVQINMGFQIFKPKQIYLDNAATTRVDRKVIAVMQDYFDLIYGNPSSQHLIGQEAKRALEDARGVIAKSINAKHDEIIFTGSGTESNNLVLKGLFFANKENKTGKNHIITTKIEHDCILNTCRWLEKQGAKITYINVDKEGFIDLEQLKNSITPETLVVSVIHGNNEIGTIQDIKMIGKICNEKQVYFHTDACQSYTKTKIDVKDQNLSFVTLNAHKIHGPKGVGALYIRSGIKLTPLLHGGGHEFGIRSSTENVPGIVGFAKAVKVSKNSQMLYIKRLRDRLMDGLLAIEGTKLNGPEENRLNNNLNISFGNIEGEAIGGYLDSYGISSSTGSACSSHKLEASHVLKAIGRTDLEANSSVRLSLSKYNTEEEVDYVLEVLPKIVDKLRKMSPIKI